MIRKTSFKPQFTNYYGLLTNSIKFSENNILFMVVFIENSFPKLLLASINITKVTHYDEYSDLREKKVSQDYYLAATAIPVKLATPDVPLEAV